MKILITGANGFVGKNLVATLQTNPDMEICQYEVDTDRSLLDVYTRDCEFVFHLAGVNRPKTEDEFVSGNPGFTAELLQALEKNQNHCPVLITSSTQAALDNPYGRSKKASEDLIFNYGREKGVRVMVYRFPNIFGKWCRPNYNSGVATFCHNIARDLPITVNDPSVMMNLIYIDDLIQELLNAMEGKEQRENGFCVVPMVQTRRLGDIVDLIYSFKESRHNLSVPYLADKFIRDLYATYLSYLPEDQFGYPLKMNVDHRGSFTEIIRTPDRGQVSVNISKPGITKGNHWHHTKNEKFLVVSGRGVIRFRQAGGDQVTEYLVSGDKLEVLDIPTGYTHNIENLGDTDLVTIMWASEAFDPEKPDTIFLEV